MKISININDSVKVKLTDKGKEILGQPKNSYYKTHRYNDNTSVLSVSIWELMEIFGEHLYNGCTIPFAHNEIILDKFD